MIGCLKPLISIPSCSLAILFADSKGSSPKIRCDEGSIQPWLIFCALSLSKAPMYSQSSVGFILPSKISLGRSLFLRTRNVDRQKPPSGISFIAKLDGQYLENLQNFLFSPIIIFSCRNISCFPNSNLVLAISFFALLQWI